MIRMKLPELLLVCIICVAVPKPTEGTYMKTSIKDNCPLNSVVATEAKCKQAATQLGLTWYEVKTDENLPAGCYFTSNLVYFNTIIDPSLTSTIYGPYGAICIKGGCVDELPQDYGTVNGKCLDEWTCSDWAGTGSKNSKNYCLYDWSSIRHCVPNSNGKIKDYCKLSCENCAPEETTTTTEVFSEVYVLKAVNDLCSNTGIIDSLAECKAATRYLKTLGRRKGLDKSGRITFRTESAASYPKGCYTMGRNTANVFWNTHISGNAKHTARPICKEEIDMLSIPTTTTAPEETTATTEECLPLSQDAGRCGPNWGGRCDKNLEDWAVYCNLDNGWCGDAAAHMNAQPGDAYDWEPSSCHDSNADEYEGYEYDYDEETIPTTTTAPVETTATTEGTSTYWNTRKGENCPLENVLVSVDECKNGASQLGMDYIKIVSGNSRPAGCWFQSSVSVHGSPELNVFFNTVINPSLTSPKSTDGGVCRADENDFVKRENTFCDKGHAIAEYTTLSEAQYQCWQNSLCTSVYDYKCDDERFWTCSGIVEPSSSGTCTWTMKHRETIPTTTIAPEETTATTEDSVANGVGGAYYPSGVTRKANALLACESVYGTGKCSSNACGSCNDKGYHSIDIASPCNGATMWNYDNQQTHMACDWGSCSEVIVSFDDKTWESSCSNGVFDVKPTPEGENYGVSAAYDTTTASGRTVQGYTVLKTMCYYDEFGTKRVKSCKDDTDILDAYIEYYCSNMACGDNSRYCAPTCIGCGTKLEFCGQDSYSTDLLSILSFFPVPKILVTIGDMF